MSLNNSDSTIVIIGGGFSGIAVAANLIKHAVTPLQIIIVEKSNKFARGVAYSTPENYHLLNVPANNMGIFADNPEDFLNWLKNNKEWQDEFGNLPIEAGRFYPRRLYGAYLEDSFTKLNKEAKAKNINIKVINDEVIDVEITPEREALLYLKNSVLPHARHVVIATGNTPVKSFAFAHGIFLCKDKYVENIWSAGDDSIFLRQDLSHLPESTTIAIIGTGLTMVDAFLSLHNKGYNGKIIAISRHGKLPHPHDKTENYPDFIKDTKPQSALKLLKLIRAEVKKAAKEGYGWRSVLNALRPVTNDIWESLAVKERRTISKKLISYWNIHRHRVPAKIYQLIDLYIKSGRLNIIAGTIYYIGGRSNGHVIVSYRKYGDDFMESLPADYVINCSGPQTDIAKSGNKLLLKLRDKGIINIGTLRAGIELTKTGRVKGKAPDIFHAVGALLVGEQLESTAVPDIRLQAFEAAQRILSSKSDEDYSKYYNYFI